MRKTAAFFAVALAASTLAAATAGFGLDAFNRTVSAAARGNAAFSPFAFEIDCVIFSEAFGALTRAKYAETMGVLNGLENVYRPLYEAMEQAEDRKFTFLTARAFCLPDERKAHPAYRKWMQGTFGTEAFTVDFSKGAGCWFRARMDGDMEDFEVPAKSAPDGYYSYFDLVSVRFPWKDAFPTNNTREIKFTLADGTAKTLPAMCDLRAADVWTRKNHAILRLPMANDAWFFALLPNEGTAVRDIRGELMSSKLQDITAGIKSITELGISHAPAAVVIPHMDITTEVDLKPAFMYFNFPLNGMERMEKGVCPRFLQQRVRFRLDERGPGAPVAEKSADEIVPATAETQRVVLNRPFLFFIYHEPTTSIPVVGQFTGQ